MEKTKIYCPRCGRKVITHDGKSSISLSCKCKKCDVLVTFNPIDRSIKIRKIPERLTASGLRFY